MKANTLNAISSLLGGLHQGMDLSRARKVEDEDRMMKRQYMQSLVEKARGRGRPGQQDYLGASELEYGGFAPGAQIRPGLAPALMGRMSAMGRTQASKRTKDDMLKQFNTVNKEMSKLAVEKAKLEASYSRQAVSEDEYAEKLADLDAVMEYNKKLRNQIRTKLTGYGIEPPETSLVDEVDDAMGAELPPPAFGENVGDYLGGLKQQFSQPIDFIKNLLGRGEDRGVGGGF